MSKIEKSYSSQLLEIQKLLERAEEERFADSLSAEERAELERASLVLRNRERELIALIGKEIAAKIKESAPQLESLAKEIRAKTTKMGKTTQSITKVKRAIQMINSVLGEIKSL
ncbi:MAG: hypothetical protein WC960_06230 [Bacteroidales bacterium]